MIHNCVSYDYNTIHKEINKYLNYDTNRLYILRYENHILQYAIRTLRCNIYNIWAQFINRFQNYSNEAFGFNYGLQIQGTILNRIYQKCLF